MWTERDLPDLTDPATIGRGRAYARSERVVALRRQEGTVTAEVQGTEPYRVELTGSTWSCDCPVGVTGAFCKHCVAVVVVSSATAGPDAAAPEPDGAGVDVQVTSSIHAWIDALPAEDLRNLLREAVTVSGEVSGALARAHADSTGDLTALRAQVEADLKPRRRFYEYRQANDYARDAHGLIDHLTDPEGLPATLDLLRLLERALALTVRTILRSDDSSGSQGDQIRALLDRHAEVAARIGPDLPAKERRRLATWLHAFRFSGDQDFFDPDVVAYGAALGETGVGTYRELVEGSRAKDVYGVRYALGRLAVLDRDADAIVRIVGEGLTNAYLIPSVVAALDEAGHHRLAVRHAEEGVRRGAGNRTGDLVDRLVRDAVERGDLAEATRRRLAHFESAPGTGTLAALRAAARDSGEWDVLRATAEATLAEKAGWQWIGELLRQGRDEEAWDFAQMHPDDATAARVWERLCARRARTAPADTLPVYRELVSTTLERAGRQNYTAAAKLLIAMRKAADAAGEADAFAEFLAATVEMNRRRPTCLAEFRRAGLTD